MAYDSSNTFQNSLSFTFTTAGPLNDLGRSTFSAVPTGVSYLSGVTNRLILTPAAGGTTINGIDASGCSDGFTILIVNGSTTDNLIFNNQGGGISTNQFANVSSGQVALLPLGAARCTYVSNFWRFA